MDKTNVKVYYLYDEEDLELFDKAFLNHERAYKTMERLNEAGYHYELYTAKLPFVGRSICCARQFICLNPGDKLVERDWPYSLEACADHVRNGRTYSYYRKTLNQNGGYLESSHHDAKLQNVSDVKIEYYGGVVVSYARYGVRIKRIRVIRN